MVLFVSSDRVLRWHSIIHWLRIQSALSGTAAHLLSIIAPGDVPVASTVAESVIRRSFTAQKSSKSSDRHGNSASSCDTGMEMCGQ